MTLKAILRRTPLPALLVLALQAFTAATAATSNPDTDYDKNLRLSAKPGDQTELSKAEATARDLFRGVTPPAKGKTVRIIKSDRHILYGDLFHNGKTYALVELSTDGLEFDITNHAGMGFAVWSNSKWKMTGFWWINPLWRPEGWKRTDDEPYPVTPSTKPFWTIEVARNKPPLVIVVGGVWRYWQEHYLAMLDEKTDTLHFFEETKSAIPVGGYLRLYEDSGHRAVFTGWEFRNWTGKELIPVVYWQEGLDKSEEHEVLTAVVHNKRGAKGATYEVQKNDDDGYHVTLDNKSYAEIKIAPKKGATRNPEAESAYFFCKLTGLPMSHYPPAEDGPKPPKLEDIATITVTGSKEAVKRLKPRSWFSR